MKTATIFLLFLSSAFCQDKLNDDFSLHIEWPEDAPSQRESPSFDIEAIAKMVEQQGQELSLLRGEVKKLEDQNAKLKGQLDILSSALEESEGQQQEELEKYRELATLNSRCLNVGLSIYTNNINFSSWLLP